MLLLTIVITCGGLLVFTVSADPALLHSKLRNDSLEQTDANNVKKRLQEVGSSF